MPLTVILMGAVIALVQLMVVRLYRTRAAPQNRPPRTYQDEVVVSVLSLHRSAISPCHRQKSQFRMGMPCTTWQLYSDTQRNTSGNSALLASTSCCNPASTLCIAEVSLPSRSAHPKTSTAITIGTNEYTALAATRSTLSGTTVVRRMVITNNRVVGDPLSSGR